MVANPDLFKRVTLNLERAPHEWIAEHIEECKRLGIVPPKTTMTDVINHGFKNYGEMAPRAVRASWKTMLRATLKQVEGADRRGGGVCCGQRFYVTRQIFVLLLLGGCWELNPDYRRPAAEDLATGGMADMLLSSEMNVCPSYPKGGGGGKGRPEVLVKGGRYAIEGVQFDVANFYVDVFEVTVGAYRECFANGTGPCTKPDMGTYCNWSDMAGVKEDHPINCVDWMQADVFCKWSGRRLLSEGEWEYAAAGTMKSTYPWGAQDPQRGDQGRLCWDRMLGTCSGGGYEKTLLGDLTCLGVADLAGNVWEWTNAEYKKPYASPETTCKQAPSGCSRRGGSWDHFDSTYVRTETRENALPTARSGFIGFRCGRNAS